MHTLAQIPDLSDEHVLLPDAALDVSNHVGKFVSDQTLRRAARRIGALRIDARGHYTIPRSVVDLMKQNMASLGYLVRRGQRSMEKAR
jgi:hypothetical protein